MRERRDRAATLLRVQRARLPHAFVGGLDLQPEASQTVEVLDAATGASMGRVSFAHPRDVERAAEAARGGAERLARGPADQAAELAEAMARAVAAHFEDLAILASLETGRSYRDVVEEDLQLGLAAMRWAAASVRSRGAVAYALDDGAEATLERSPAPVQGVVLPGPESLGAALRHLARGLALGCGTILVAPIEAPLAVLELARLSRSIDLPPGVLNVLSGSTEETARRLAESPEVDLVHFAGPLVVARHLLVEAAKSNLKPILHEPEDKLTAVVWEDADLGEAVNAIARSAFTSRSQLSRGVARVLCARPVHAEVANGLSRRALRTTLGHPLDEHTDLGPLASAERLRRVLAFVELGRREGARLVTGGSRDVEGERFKGFFVHPTVFLDPPSDGRVARESIEGPVLTVEAFGDDEALMRRLGRGRTDLLAFGRSQRRVRALARAVRARRVWVNGPVRVDPRLPLAGGLGMDALLGGSDPLTMVRARSDG